MEGIFSTEVVLAIIAALSAGIGYLGKWFLNKRDEAQKRVFEQRDKDKAEIRENIETLKGEVADVKKDVRDISAIILECDNPSCTAKKKLAEHWRNKEVA